MALVGMERLTAKVNHFLRLKREKGVSLNDQLVSHPDFHAPGITETLVRYLDVDPWSSAQAPAQLPWEEEEVFDYAKVAAEQRATWEASNQQRTSVNFVKK